MSLRSALAPPPSRTKPTPLQPAYVSREPAGGPDAVFRFSVPVLRVRDVSATVAWYRRHLGFTADTFPDGGGERGAPEFAILERDGVQLLVRRAVDARGVTRDGHSGWDLYLWADGVDLARLEASIGLAGGLVRSLSPMGTSVAELEVRDPDGYVLCIGGPVQPAVAPT